MQVLGDAAGLQVRDSQALLASPRLHERPRLCVATRTQAVQRPERDQPVSAVEKRVVGLELGAVQHRLRTGRSALVSICSPKSASAPCRTSSGSDEVRADAAMTARGGRHVTALQRSVATGWPERLALDHSAERMSSALIRRCPEEHDRTVRRTPGQNGETPRIGPGHTSVGGQLF